MTQRWAAFAAFFETLGDDLRGEPWERLARRRLASDARYAATRAFVRDDADSLDGEVSALLDLANEIDADEPLGDRLGWGLRRRLGPRWSRRFPGFLLRPLISRLGRLRDEHRRLRSGVA